MTNPTSQAPPGATTTLPLRERPPFPYSAPRRLLVVGLVLLTAVVPLSLAAAGDGVLAGDVSMARAIQHPGGSALDDLAGVVNWMGDGFPATVVLAAVAAALLALTGRRAEAGLVVAAAAVRALNPAMKALVESPRPTPDLVRVIEHADGLGFPSGHASGAILFYGALAGVVPSIVERPWLRRLLQAAAALMVLAVGLARVRTGAHWPSDVLGGYLWGGLLLTILFAAYRAARRRSASR